MPLSMHELQLRIPCDRRVQDMSPVPGGRYCGECELTVQDLSQLTEHEARTLLRLRDERRVCVSYRPLRDGTVRTAPESVVPEARLLRKARPALFVAATMLAACGPVIDALPDDVQAKIPYAVDAALRHPVDVAVCAASPDCEVEPPREVLGML